jgi:hydroxypyruvate isomerase
LLAGHVKAAAPHADAKRQLAGLACNMESWWTNLPFMQRFEQAVAHGFSAIEFWNYGVDGRDMNAVAKLCASLGLDIIQFTGWGGPSLADAANHEKFAESMRRAIELAHELDAPMFTVVGHQQLDETGQEESVANLASALEKVAPILEDGEKMLILEPFNPVDHQGHFLNGSADALQICRSIDSPFVKINWDLYHMQLSEGNLVANMRDGMDQIGYVQVADVPGRHQPGSGELNYRFIFEELQRMGYKGPVGLECWPDKSGEQQAIADIVALRR